MAVHEDLGESTMSFPTNLDEVDALFARKLEIQPKIVEAKRQAAEIAKNAKRMADTIVVPLAEEDQAIDDAIRRYLTRRRPSLIRRLGKTITLPHGVIKWFVRSAVELPGNQDAAIDELLRIRGGRKYLVVTYSLDEGAIKHAPKSIRSRLAKHGVVVGRFEHLNINVGTMGPIKLSRRRYLGPLSQRNKQK